MRVHAHNPNEARLWSQELFQPSFPFLNLKVDSFSHDWGFPDSSVGKESACNAGDLGSIPGLGRSAGEGIGYPLQYSWTSLVAQLVKNPPAMWETWVRSLGWEDLLEKERIPTPVFLPGELHGLYSPWGCKESAVDWAILSTPFPNSEADTFPHDWHLLKRMQYLD